MVLIVGKGRVLPVKVCRAKNQEELNIALDYATFAFDVGPVSVVVIDNF